jgi:VWFA-related protein
VRTSRLLPLAVALALLGSSASPQPPPVFGARADLVVIDQVDSACEPDLPGALQNAIGAGQVFIDNARLSMSTALGGMAAVGRYLAPLPGRKHLVYYSAGYPMDPADTAILVIQSICQGRSSATSLGATRSDVQAALRGGSAVDSIGLLQALVDEANRAQVSVYTVDARGLMGDMPPARSRTPARLARSAAAQEAQRRAVRAPQEILRSIADGTGGTASVNTNDLARGMQAAAKDARGYYLLAYDRPPAAGKDATTRSR